MDRRQRLLFRIGCYTLLVTALVHLVGFLSGPQAPANDTERTLISLMTAYEFDVMGTKVTMMRLFEGFSLSYSVFLAWTGAVGLMAVARAQEGSSLGPGLARIHLLGSLAMLVVSFAYWFMAPTLCMGVATLAFAGATFLPARA